MSSLVFLNFMNYTQSLFLYTPGDMLGGGDKKILYKYKNIKIIDKVDQNQARVISNEGCSLTWIRLTNFRCIPSPSFYCYTSMFWN